MIFALTLSAYLLGAVTTLAWTAINVQIFIYNKTTFKLNFLGVFLRVFFWPLWFVGAGLKALLDGV